MPVRILDLEFDDANEDEMWRHRVTPEEVWQVLENAPIVLPNTSGHRQPLVLLGPTFGGRLLVVPLAPIDEPGGIWRPATAWQADASEEARYHQVRRRS